MLLWDLKRTKRINIKFASTIFQKVQKYVLLHRIDVRVLSLHGIECYRAAYTV